MLQRTEILSTIILILLFHLVTSAQSGKNEKFEVLGMGGAGGMYTPASSPENPDLMLVSCDMSGSYRSLNGGKTWEMIHSDQLHSSRECRPMFIGKTIYWISNGQLRYSTDQGKSWTVSKNIPWKESVKFLTYLPGREPTIFAGAGNNLYSSKDGGQTWNNLVQGTGPVRGLTAAGKTVFTAFENQIHKSSDNGKTWQIIDIPGMTNEHVSGMTAGYSKKKTIVFVAIDQLGIFRSQTSGKTWEKVLGKGEITLDGTTIDSNLSDILMPPGQTKIAYANNRHQILKTEDGGTSWRSVFRMDSYANPGKSTMDFNVIKSWVQTELKWGYYITDLGLGVNPADPDIAMVSTQGDLYITKDGGVSWDQVMNQKLGALPGDPGPRYRSIGLEVTSSWNFYFDPFDRERYYIAYTDIGFARSVDRGATWIHSANGSGNWGNTFYNLVFDPEIKGRIYAAASNRHDIPHWTHITPNESQHEGGVVLSSDHGASWRRLNNGLPKVPCIWVEIDPKSPKEQRILYAAMFGEGIYKSFDNGENWVKKSNGLGNEGNMHVLQVLIHPVTGDLFASITAKRVNNNQFPIPGGLWKSTDGGENWSDLTAGLQLKWPTYFALHPADPEIIYLSASTAPQASQGGLYATKDGGKTWIRMLADVDFAKKASPSYVQASAVKLHPSLPDYIYLCSSHGLWVSTDAGQNWKWFNGIPFRSAQNVAFDPNNPKAMFVNTFGGGVWKGYYLPD